MALLTEIDYQPDPGAACRALGGLPWTVFLDSGHPSPFAARFDVIAADPTVTLVTRGDETEIVRRDGRRERSTADPLTLIRSELGDTGKLGKARPRGSEPDLPFRSGAIGYFGYDLGRRYERIDGTAVDDVGMPEMAVGIYEASVVIDHQAQRSWIAGSDGESAAALAEQLLARLREVDATPPPRRFEVIGDVTSNLPRAAYAVAFATIKDNIRRGNCYQANLTQRFEAAVQGGSWDAYLALRESNPAPFSAYLDFPDGQILCSSPERFLRVRDGEVETKPIKGTRRRSADDWVDRHRANELLESEKDRAENVMIVDLLRNDLGKCCEAGSIRAEPLFEIESFAGVHHLVSTIRGRLKPDCDALDMLRAAFPGGSITGAPKRASMQVIDTVEPNRRSVYCGAIGYIGHDGNMDTNIAIRTLVRRGSTIYAWAGGGIVADSDRSAEYQESFDKAEAMLSVLSSARPAAAG